MNCFRGICRYRQDGTHLCKLDEIKGKEPAECDMEQKAPKDHECKYGLVGCEMCYKYDTCTET